MLEFLKRLPSGSKAIITSRRRNDVQAEIIRLERIEWKDATQLISELARNNPWLARTSVDDRRALYDHAGGNPLILRWVAGQLGRGSCRDVASALELLNHSIPGEK